MATKFLASLAGVMAMALALTSCDAQLEPDGQSPRLPTEVSADPTGGFQNQVAVMTPSAPTPETEKQPVHTKDPTIEELLAMERWFNTADLGIKITSGLETVVPGQQVIYDISFSSVGPNPAEEIWAIVVLPDGITYDHDTALCDAQEPGRLSCDLGGFSGSFGRREFHVAAVVDEGLSEDSVLITNVSIENRVIGPFDQSFSPTAWPDPDPENNTATDTMRLIVPDRTTADREIDTMLWTEPIHLLEKNNSTDLKLTMYSDVGDGRLTAGVDFEYGFLIINGSNPARDTRLSVYLPEETTYLPGRENCVQSAAHQVDCVIGQMKIHERSIVTLRMLSDEDVGKGVDGNVNLTGKATVENLSGPDPDPSNNTSSTIIPVKYDVKMRDHILEGRNHGLN